MRGIRETFMTTLNLGNLATFRLVVQRGSFSAAADALGISQPAVSLAGTSAGAVFTDQAAGANRTWDQGDGGRNGIAGPQRADRSGGE